MRICIFGAGAVGSHFAVRLALAGHDVSCVMRGPHLAAVKGKRPDAACRGRRIPGASQGIRRPGGAGSARSRDLDAEGDRGRRARRPGCRRCLGDDTGVVFAQNGIPWWYDIGLASDHPPTPDLGFLDPGGALRSAVSRERIIGGVIFSSNEVIAPGIVANLSPERNMLLVGECDDRNSERIERLRAALEGASIDRSR